MKEELWIDCDQQQLMRFLETAYEDKQGLIGFDGFVDEIYRIVAKSAGYSKELCKSIPDFADKIYNAAGFSTNIEMLRQVKKLGGNAPIMASSMISLGSQVHFCGAVKNSEVFRYFKQKCYSNFEICEPGRTMALEFNDGKVMLCEQSMLESIRWKDIAFYVSQILPKCDFIAAVNWTEIPHTTEIYSGLVSSIFNMRLHIPLFIDLADFSRRSETELLAGLNVLSEIKSQVHLGLNLSEARNLSVILGIKAGTVKSMLNELHNYLGFASICIHSHREVWAVSSEMNVCQSTLHVENPKISTGAGDHFNAGYFTAIVHGASLNTAVSMGILNSAYYVRTGSSPERHDLCEFFQEMFLVKF